MRTESPLQKLKELKAKSQKDDVLLYLVIDKPSHYAIKKSPHGSDRILARAYPGGRAEIMDLVFAGMVTKEQDEKGEPK